MKIVITKKKMGMNHDQEWLQLPLEYWTLMKDYKNLRAFVSVLEVVNDSAERGIKIVSDFKDVCRNLDTQEYLFHVVEAHRKKIIDFNKTSLQQIKNLKSFLVKHSNTCIYVQISHYK
jgi:hypothetical protein